MATAYDIVEALSPGFWLSNYRSDSVRGLVQPMRFPGMVLLWYSVLAVRVPHPREAVRAFYTRLLLRRSLLGVVVAVPAAALGWVVLGSPERTVGAVVGDPLAQALAAATGLLLLVAADRERLLVRLDAWVYPETVDQRRALATATSALAQALRITTIRETVTRTVERGCGSPGILLVAADPDTKRTTSTLPTPPWRRWRGRRPSCTCWRRSADRFVSIRTTAPRSASCCRRRGRLGRRNRRRRTGGGARFRRRGHRRSGRRPALRRSDRAAGRHPVPRSAGGGRGPGGCPSAPAARRGGRVAGCAAGVRVPGVRMRGGRGEPGECDCGPQYVETAIPRLLAGKYRLTRRLGSGGMGRVYLARDVLLERDVAVKTLPPGSGSA